jgi:hypothetical protein
MACDTSGWIPVASTKQISPNYRMPSILCSVGTRQPPNATSTSWTFRPPTWEPAFRKSRRFRRGWTLQELLAPRSVEFFSRDRKRLGNKKTLESQIHDVTKIAVSVLRGTSPSQFSVEERFSWSKDRQTTRKEDKLYSLLGIFEVHMPLIYGEGEKNALKRLRKEIGKPSNPLYSNTTASAD